VVLRFA